MQVKTDELYRAKDRLVVEPYKRGLLLSFFAVYAISTWLLFWLGLGIEPAPARLALWGVFVGIAGLTLTSLAFWRARRAVERGVPNPGCDRQNFLYMGTIALGYAISIYYYRPEEVEGWAVTALSLFFALAMILGIEEQARFAGQASVRRDEVRRISRELADLLKRAGIASKQAEKLRAYEDRRTRLKAIYSLRYDMTAGERRAQRLDDH